MIEKKSKEKRKFHEFDKACKSLEKKGRIKAWNTGLIWEKKTHVCSGDNQDMNTDRQTDSLPLSQTKLTNKNLADPLLPHST